jgi:hypothetical protein
MLPTVQFEPNPRQWPALARASRPSEVWRGRPIEEWRGEARRELGLSDDQLIIATGHQAGFWHPGILAKFIAADAVVDGIGRGLACALHLVVDQDDNDCVHVDVPTRTAESMVQVESVSVVEPPEGSWTVHSPHGGATMERPSGEVPALRAISAAATVLHPAVDSITPGLCRIEALLRAYEGEPSLARQMARAVNDCLAVWMRPPAIIAASQLLDGAAGREFVRAIADDAAACALAYNEAVASNGGGVRPLTQRTSGHELPLWRIDEHGRRQAVFSDEVGRVPLSRLRPRALLMTAFMRLMVCDLFIHGRGGWEYDRAAEWWMRRWMGIELSPMAMATADLRLPLWREGDAPMRAADAIVAFRRAWHDPWVVDGRGASRAKAKMVATIQNLARKASGRREAYQAMQLALQRERGQMASHFERLRAQIERARAYDAQRVVIERRDWAFPLHSRADLDALNALIRARFAGDSG